MRVLSGIQPTGPIHWGNYFGAIRQYIALQGNEQAFYFVANLHALNNVRDPAKLREYTLNVAIDLLALGLDPNRATLFVQSDIPEVSQLCWILLTGTPMSLLERCVAYKDKIAKGLSADAGLFTYPVLQAADILAYDSDTVPVGEDQVQHIEVCRDLARGFNKQYGKVFIQPEAHVLSSAARVPGTDGEKMSKSYNNTLGVFEAPNEQRKKIMRIGTDSRERHVPKEPDGDVLFDLFSLVASDDERNSMALLYRSGGFGYGEVKHALADAADRFFRESRERRVELLAHPDNVKQILGDGAATARRKAKEVLKRVQAACGISAAESYKSVASRTHKSSKVYKNAEQIAKRTLERFSLEVKPLEKGADLIAVDDDCNAFIFEVKAKISDLESESLASVNRSRRELEKVFEDAISRINQTAKDLQDFRVVWLSLAGNDRFIRWEQALASFYGVAALELPSTHQTVSTLCFYFNSSISQLHREIDALVVSDGEFTQLCLNEFSARYRELRETGLVSEISAADGGITIDPMYLTQLNSVTIFRRGVSGDKESIVSGTVQAQLPAGVRPVKNTRNALSALLPNRN